MKFNLKETLEAKGFIPVADPYGCAPFGNVMQKTYEKEVEVAWFGKRKSSLTVNIRFTPDFRALTVSYGQNEHTPFKTKTHLSDRRALNAITTTIANNGFEL